MDDLYMAWTRMAEQSPGLNILLSSMVLAAASWVGNWITKFVLLRGLRKYVIGHFFKITEGEDDESPMRAISRLSNVVPAIIIYTGVIIIPDLPNELVVVVKNVCNAFIILTLGLAVGNFLDWVNQLYHHRPDAARKPIKGYIQLLKLFTFMVMAVLIIATLLDRSPVILLSGLGAMAAVLMLIFQDTILSFVASVQLNSNDMVRVGDWVEMPNLNADGEVVDIALHTIKVQNWDKTITTIPTKRMITDAFKNWRGMSESGGRRIKRSLFIDQQSVHFLTRDEIKRLERLKLIDTYLQAKETELIQWNQELQGTGADEINYRRLTNLGTFRAYVVRYLNNHPRIHQGMTLLVRHLNPTSEGIPLEVYCFTNTTVWNDYEEIQADIFDHLLAIITEFDLRVFQNPSGNDMREITTGIRKPQNP